MRRFRFLLLLLLITGTASAQFPLNMLLPSGVSNVSYGDTLLQGRGLLRQAGIRRITELRKVDRKAYISPVITRVGPNGEMLSRQEYITRNDSIIPAISMKDTSTYDEKGRLQTNVFADASDRVFLKLQLSYYGDSTWLYVRSSGSNDTTRIHTDTVLHLYNSSGRLIYRKHTGADWKDEAARIYWAADGLPDSIVYDNARRFPTQVFHRRATRKGMELSVTGETTSFTWTYKGERCVRTQWKSRKGFQPATSADIRYFYNPDGTLRHVEETYMGARPTLVDFTYEK